MEASDWEAKFYQIQSKYLLLLNELHNPQVMVSATRQEMVGHLLKDIVDNSEKPTLNSDTPEHDRFGFRFEEGASLIEKAERLQRIAEENLAETELSLEEVETRWQDVVLGLTRRDISRTLIGQAPTLLLSHWSRASERIGGFHARKESIIGALMP